MTYTFDTNIVSDLHKDARGFRPNQYWWQQWTMCSDRQKQIMWDSLCDELDAEIEHTKKEQAKAGFDLCERIEKMYELGAKTEAQAIQWIIEAEEFSDMDLQYGADYFCYHFGLNYNAKNEFPIQEAINQTLFEVA